VQKTLLKELLLLLLLLLLLVCCVPSGFTACRVCWLLAPRSWGPHLCLTPSLTQSHSRWVHTLHAVARVWLLVWSVLVCRVGRCGVTPSLTQSHSRSVGVSRIQVNTRMCSCVLVVGCVLFACPLTCLLCVLCLLLSFLCVSFTGPQR
jgi:hypothetical protein